MADQKITQLPAGTTIHASDFLVFVDESGVPTTKKMTVQNFVNTLPPPVPHQVLSSFTNTSPFNEIGSTVNNFTLNWAYNRAPDPTSQSIDHGIGAIAVNLRSHNVAAAGLTTNTTYTISAVGDDGFPSALGTSISFLPKVYYGVSNTILDNSTASAAFIADLVQGQFLSNTELGSYIYDATPAPGNNYLYLFYPASFADPANATFGGFAYSDYTIVTKVNFTNASGHTSNYRVLRSNLQYNSANLHLVFS